MAIDSLSHRFYFILVKLILVLTELSLFMGNCAEDNAFSVLRTGAYSRYLYKKDNRKRIECVV